MPPVTINLIHGIGATKPGQLLEKVSHILCKVNPEIVLDSPTEIHEHNNKIALEVPIYTREGTIGEKKLFISDTYWGDISKIKKGPVNFILGLLISLFGLRFFSASALEGHSRIKKILYYISVILFKGIAILALPFVVIDLVYIVILLTYTAFFVETTNTGSYSIIATAIICLSGSALLLYRIRHPRIEWPLMRWALISTGIFSILIFIIASLVITNKNNNSETLLFNKVKYHSLDNKISPWKEIVNATLYTETSEKYCKQRKLNQTCIYISGVYLAALGIVRILTVPVAAVIIICILALLFIFFIGGKYSSEEKKGTLLASLSCMVFVWLFSILSIPVNVLSQPAMKNSLMGDLKIVKFYWHDYVPLYFLGGLILIAFFLWMQRRFMKRYVANIDISKVSAQQETSNESSGDHKRFWRLIVSPAHTYFIIFGTALCVILIAILLADIPQLRSWFEEFRNASEQFPIWLMAVLATGALLYITRTGLEMVMDVINHFSGPKNDFPLRKQITKRFRESIKFSLRKLDKPHLVIIAHSQGTVTLLDELFNGMWDDTLSENVSSLTILTFGSPYTHIYQNYFPSQYPDLTENDSKLKGLSEDNRVNWYNIYRIDDYVGTTIAGPDKNFPTNIAMPVGGHTNYWKVDVFTHLVEENILPT